ncbi:MAG: 2-C-methyl-D-erythritol 4-phosphate cytidylyltransferase [Mucilaginibacter sp.]|uniref:2-C-methyl-D-erythritol 4-phosphate cytidylyltransferase n=1 Tax=Mucilaginibacter sp. TaxID=1882438 RepID=UPI0032674232
MSLDTNYLILDTNPNYAIIVAGGSGSRMQSAVPKQFLLLNGKPVLMYTIETFYNSRSRPAIIIVLPANYHHYWLELCKDHDFRIPHHLVNGGDTRFQSVKNGLELISNPDAVIAVQDAVRPLTDGTVINESFIHAKQYGNAVVAVKSRDSIRQVKNNISSALVRDEIYLVQTPQTFQSSLLREAYQQEYSSDFTDDASVVERLGVNINIIEGSYTNIKITFPEDVIIAEMLLKQNSH